MTQSSTTLPAIRQTKDLPIPLHLVELVRKSMASIAVVRRPNSYSDRWLKVLAATGRQSTVYEPDQATDMLTCLPDILLWHWHQQNPFHDVLPLQLLRVLRNAGVVLYPNIVSAEVFDDKIAQFMLLQAHGIHHPDTFVCYSERRCLEVIQNMDPPWVFKLRRGAGSLNVALVDNMETAASLIRTAFTTGFARSTRGKLSLREIAARHRSRRTSEKLRHFAGALGRRIRPTPTPLWDIHGTSANLPTEGNHLIIQRYVAHTGDIRVTVIGDRAFAFSRGIRPDRFGASGSGIIHYDSDLVSEALIRSSFHVSDALGMPVVALDWLMDGEHPTLLEVSHGFVSIAVYRCRTHWTREGGVVRRVIGSHVPEDLILEHAVTQFMSKANSTASTF